MENFLWLLPALPFAGFVLLAVAGNRLSRPAIAIAGTGSVGLAAVVAIVVIIAYVALPRTEHAFTQTLWTWLNVGGFSTAISFYLDSLSAVMVLVVTIVGFLIHLYSIAFMRDEDGFARFFCYMNLFIAAMLTLVLADNLPMLLLGWEGVGLCSYLLIGFWYREPANGRAARKAFIVTRIGDSALLIGLLLLFRELGTLQIQEIMQRAEVSVPSGSAIAVAAAALLLAGALGKSAQLPLQTWLPDAMAGPTPVSALIHAATMVTAGVYLIARLHVLFTLAPIVLSAVAVIGALTLLYGGFSALAQRDLKRALAYSTISQIGYMFLALGVGAWTAAIFHMMTHAFFKALLFLCAGVVILALNHEQDMFRMGGLRRRLPLTFWTFLVGAASLSAVPLVTAGFYSKEAILEHVWASPNGQLLWAAGLVGALLTALYAFRMLFLVFYGERQMDVHAMPSMSLQLPLVALGVLSIVGGWLELPRNFGNFQPFSVFLDGSLGRSATDPPGGLQATVLQLVSAAASAAGIFLAYQLFSRRRRRSDAASMPRWAPALTDFWRDGWGFDRLYNRLVVSPFVNAAQLTRHDFFDQLFGFVVSLCRAGYRFLSSSQSGHVRWYATAILLGVTVLVGIGVLR